MNYKEGCDSFYSRKELLEIGFASLGSNVLISRKASIYNPDKMHLGNNVRIDDFCCISGFIQVGNNCHITPFCLLAGGDKGIIIGNYCTFAYRVSIFSQSDDYSGESMTNSTVPIEFKKEIKSQINISDHVIIGCSSVILPGVCLAEGTSIGASSLVLKSTKPWGIYIGAPSKRIKDRSQMVLTNTAAYESSIINKHQHF